MPLPTPLLGKFITFEGSEGSGKSTQIARLTSYLQGLGREVVTTREPGGTEIGEQIRNIIVHNAKGDEMCPETELLLFTAARAQVVREVIAPALSRGAVVLSDRFLDSSTVYQGIARDLATDPVRSINQFAVGGIMPQLTILIDIPTEVSLTRVRARASNLPDRMEREGPLFYNKIREGYLQLARAHPQRIVVADGTLPLDALELVIRTAVQRVLG